jgi:hypothetical protein
MEIVAPKSSREKVFKDSCVVMRSIDHLHALVLTVYTSAPALEHEISIFMMS